MTGRIPGRPDLVGTVPRQLETTRTRVLRTEEAATTDAQRIAQANAVRVNETIGRVNRIIGTPFGEGETLTQPEGNGERTELLTLAKGANVIRHTLGRPAQGFAIVDLRADRTRALGAFYSTKSQAAGAINTATPVTWNQTTFTDGVTCNTGAGDSKVYVTDPGVYDFQFSIQADRVAGAADAYLYLWAAVNGTDVPWSASRVRIKGNNAEQVPAWDFMLDLAAGDYFQLMWATDDLDLELTAYAATAFCPDTPSAILTVTGPVGPILTHVERTRSEDERTIRIDSSTPCSAKIWVW